MKNKARRKEAAGLLCAKSLDCERKQVVLFLINLQKAATCAWLFALFKGQVRAKACTQTLAEIRKRGQGLFFEAL
ncbi:hypothetical protein DW094_02585 [Ruminococcaceae bacterium AM07-15]|nr:hypothetical protein DW094_02585 [Ruminococcaceae bacterium AM07-15]